MKERINGFKIVFNEKNKEENGESIVVGAVSLD